jgi:[acyl-carrier-protein] S-malonyltransferase
MGRGPFDGGGIMKRAFLFPGQGAQLPGMGSDFFDVFSVAKETFQEADDLLSFSLSKAIFTGSEADLKQTRISQLALFVHSIALFRTLQDQLHWQPDVCAGLSLGEYTALHASGRLSFQETLFLVRARGELMNRACELTQGTMAAVLGLPFSSVEEVVRTLDQVWVANYNCPQQTVISGSREGVEVAMTRLKEVGAKRVLPLQVHGAFHSPLMQSAQDGLAPLLAATQLNQTSVGLVMNVPGDFVEGLDDVKGYLIQQVTRSVRWEQGIEAMKSRGVSCYLEIGAGRTLSGLNRKMVVEGDILSLEKVTDLDHLAGVLCSS